MKVYLPAMLWAILIFLLSTSVGIQLPKRIIALDKLGHLVAYGIFNWLLIRILIANQGVSIKRVTLATLVASGYGAIMEFIQWTYFPNRYFEIWDMVANFIGASMSSVIFYLYFTKNNHYGFRS